MKDNAQDDAYGRVVELLANEFSTILRAWLTEGEMKKVIRRNTSQAHGESPYNTERSPGMLNENNTMWWCHSHDFCDANRAMDEAIQKILTPDFLSISVMINRDDWAEAWEMAMENDFLPTNVRPVSLEPDAFLIHNLDGSVTVWTVYPSAGTNRMMGHGWLVGDASSRHTFGLADRLIAAINAGAALIDAKIKFDNAGDSHVTAASVVRGRQLNADLTSLGF